MRIARCALLAVLAASPVGVEERVELRFAPDLERPVRKIWTSSGRRELERLEVRTEDVASEPEDLAMTLTGSKRLVVLDRYERVADGRPLAFVRRFEELDAKRKLETRVGDERDTVFAADTCALEGRSVRFRRMGERYGRAYADEPARVEPAEPVAAEPVELGGLAADLDLIALLPPEPVAPGDTWSVPFDGFRAVLRPGGELACTTEPRAAEGERELAERVWSSLAGEVTARYAGPAEGPAEGGGRAARVVVEGTYAGSGETRGPSQGTTARRMTTSMRIAGELVWDLELGRARGLELTTEGTVASEEDLVVAEDGVERTFRRELRFREESRISATFE